MELTPESTFTRHYYKTDSTTYGSTGYIRLDQDGMLMIIDINNNTGDIKMYNVTSFEIWRGCENQPVLVYMYARVNNSVLNNFNYPIHDITEKEYATAIYLL